MGKRYPYQETEVQNPDIQKTFFGQELEVFHTPITPRENALLLYQGKKPLWAPNRMTDFNMLMFDVDLDNKARGPEGGTDKMGIEWVYVPVAGGSMVKPGNPVVKDINHWEDYIQMPDVDSWDWAGCYERQKDQLDPNKVNIAGMLGNYFERLISLMDFDNAAVAMIDEEQQEGVHRLFRELTKVYKKMISYMKQYFDIDMINFHDDWGSQRASFFSRETAEEMLLPYMKEIADHMHSLGIYFDFHCCGFVENLVPIMIEAGMDSWGGQELNDKWALKQKYQDQLIFTDTPLVPDDATEEETQRAVDEFMKKSGADNKILVEPFTGPKCLTEKLYTATRSNAADVEI